MKITTLRWRQYYADTTREENDNEYKYKVYATATINYEVEVEGNSEIEALSALDDWIDERL
jgi:hypothetical protein